ncbi:MAG: peroxiredoxin [Rhodocyclaceae bacterium]|jgi:peroxiredoxin Q/BCP|nr:peroxiredoxin [Rhodocyclaceae bacterium]MCA3020762.1 peroxiredoxin [Rhodocyclaceae bacterium]MCA3024564.1 peroxiredoxin [Rhodocyclaceae bacterium]MCA3028274.1 peroxiredoxin [Rhodocyclaceae bacterium]MCA3030434.1 peroxiredoxin [Rhodocyclaceae bacterium]
MNTTIPDFEVAASGNQRFASAAFKGHPYIVYFYPKDDTPGCTVEGSQFRDLHAEFKKLGYMVFGVSRDSVASHDKFKAKMNFPFDLLSDKDEVMCKLFDVIKEKNMYGKKVFGIERSTFIMGRNGEIVREWRGVKVEGHAAEVLAAVKSLAVA